MKNKLIDEKPESTVKTLPVVETVLENVVIEQVQQVTPVVQPQMESSLAIVSLIIGVFAFCTGWFPFVGLIMGIAAVVFGIMAIRKKQGGNGMSIAGIITGGLAIMTGLLIAVILIISMFAGDFIRGEWRLRGSDQTLVFKDNGEFIWYMDGSDKQDNYVYGKYTIVESDDFKSKGRYDLFTLTLKKDGSRQDYGYGNDNEKDVIDLTVGFDRRDKDTVIIEGPDSRDVNQLDKVIK